LARLVYIAFVNLIQRVQGTLNAQIEVKESRNVSSLLLIELALIISDLDLFAIVLGHVCADMALASRDGWEYRSVLNFGKATALRLSGLLQ
jgi:hypothetical protein